MAQGQRRQLDELPNPPLPPGTGSFDRAATPASFGYTNEELKLSHRPNGNRW